MYSREQREAALEAYDRLGDVRAAVRELGYPSDTALAGWVRRRGEAPRPRKPAVRLDAHEKQGAVLRVLAGEEAARVAEDLGVTRPAVLNWRRAWSEEGAAAFMGDIAERTPGAAGALPDDPEELKRMVRELRMENDLMREVVELVKKDPGADPSSLTNREKAALIDALRGTYSLSSLTSRLAIPPSSYYYARRAAAAPDRWAEARAALAEEFEAVGGSRGYRYLRMRLAARGIACGERTVRRLMREEGLEVPRLRRPRRWSSYAGEVSDAPPNLVARDFRAGLPNFLWLTDVTEFRLPAPGQPKVYLSPVLDCFDGGLASWSISTSPDAELANSSLARACATLSPGEAPWVHSDRGGHYRWPGWIAICEEHGLTRSMSAKGCSPGNSACEGFFGRLKSEFFHCRDWGGVTAEEFMAGLDAWLRYYNEERPKEALGWMSPMEYRRSLGLAA